MGIIGSSDSPTAVYVYSPLGLALLIIGVVIVITAVTALIIRRRKKKRKDFSNDDEEWLEMTKYLRYQPP
jgi:Na+-transporting methylmalonyl-CoA/oxaloacetate decarboxylase beta subunit